MTGLVLDAGALIAIDRDDPDVLSEVEVARRSRKPVRTNAMALAQAWRDGEGRQANPARTPRNVEIHSISPEDGRKAGELLGVARLKDAIDASVALLANPGDRILTSDPADLRALCDAAGTNAVVVDC